MGREVGLDAEQHIRCWRIQGFRTGFILLGMKMKAQEFLGKKKPLKSLSASNPSR